MTIFTRHSKIWRSMGISLLALDLVTQILAAGAFVAPPGLCQHAISPVLPCAAAASNQPTDTKEEHRTFRSRQRKALRLRARRLVRARLRRSHRWRKAGTLTSPSANVSTSGLAIEESPTKGEEHILPPPSTKGRPLVHGEGHGLWRSVFGPRPLLEVRSVGELSRLIDEEGWPLGDLSVKTGGAGDGSVDKRWRSSHPVIRAILERKAARSIPSGRTDGMRIALSIEGGGMRGCVGAGMVSCLHYLGLADSFDAVYGASAGSLVGAYFVSRQSNGTAVYHDVLPCAGSKFVDKSQLPQALGLPLPQDLLQGMNGVFKVGKGARDRDTGVGGEDKGAGEDDPPRYAKVISLDFLLEDVVERIHALDFPTFSANNQHQPLNIVASGLESMSSVSLASTTGHFSTLKELTHCIRASMLVPGLAGPLVTVPRRLQLHAPVPSLIMRSDANMDGSRLAAREKGKTG
ncbi:unnamed protein product, partial [Discosporangium mesarthrocarpum]